MAAAGCKTATVMSRWLRVRCSADMRIAFADFCRFDFHAQTADIAPLGGSQSAACYLARSLARIGHDLFLISSLSTPGVYDGVKCLSWETTGADQLKALGLDVLVSIMSPKTGPALRGILGPATRLILWNHHSADQADAQPLHDVHIQQAFDGLAMVSQWQLEQYHQAFKIDSSRMTVMRNAIAPAFENRFSSSDSILARKSLPPILAYTSTPFRGLDLLLAAFPHIRAAIPDARLQIFSSMKVYGVSPEKDEAEYGQLYAMCRQTPGAQYIGSLPQPQLADALAGVSVLAYPNIFPETSCISVMEAMASGCRIVTSELGALPETTAGFARLIPTKDGVQDYMRRFIEQTIGAIHECAQHPRETEMALQRQVAYMNEQFTWKRRAEEWVQWLENVACRVRIADHQ
jgi:glycosyltransferase involved in cell wall biosynthesis